MLLRVQTRGEILAQRDAMVVSLQYGLCARNQEVWGLRWASLAGEFAWVREVLSCGQLEEWGQDRTQHRTTHRYPEPPTGRSLRVAVALAHSGHPVRDCDFIIPGDLTDPQHDIRELSTSAHR